MVVQPAAHLHKNPSLLCAYCGRQEELPSEDAERHRFVRLRLQQLERARLTAEAPLQQYRQIKLAMAPAAVFMAIYLVVSLSQVLRQQGHYPIGSMQLFPLALMLGMAAGWVGMMLTFRSLIQPLLKARPPERPGMPATCRSCGGDLPAIKTAQVKCPYCRADNLMSAVSAERVGGILESEFHAKMQHAKGGYNDPNVYSRPTRAFYTWGLGGLVAGIVLIEVVARLIA